MNPDNEGIGNHEVAPRSVKKNFREKNWTYTYNFLYLKRLFMIYRNTLL